MIVDLTKASVVIVRGNSRRNPNAQAVIQIELQFHDRMMVSVIDDRELAEPFPVINGGQIKAAS